MKEVEEGKEGNERESEEERGGGKEREGEE